MNRIELACNHCNHRWWVTYEELQKRALTYRGPAQTQQSGVEEYTVKCANCGEVAVHTFIRKGGQVAHGGA